ncbi:MAG: Flp pilus assembly complex ATPase component TadA [Oscillospiraceae bacterium]|nr:Flp pilus assembly complex ATPase component TadA [Oscillospiraceae bacterium]MCR4760832.1 Flp pilus assembly complex ATPase component TadA [Oscillospiraceae bacterium]
MRNIRIGDYLVEEGHITPEQLQQVLQRQRESTDQKKFGEVIVEMGFMSDIKFAQALSVKLQVPFVDLNNVEIDGEIARKVPQDLAERNCVIAINQTGRRLTVATDDPVNFNILEDIKVKTGYDTIPVLATRMAIKKAIGKAYQMTDLGDLGVDTTQGEVLDDEESRDRVESAPIVKLATQIVENAFRMEATDIHIEPFDKYTQIRVRVNGDLTTLMNVSSNVQNQLSTRLKLISGMNIAEKRIPQDGRFSQTVDGIPLDVRVSSLPMVHGEKIVIRILSTGAIKTRGLHELGMSDYNFRLFESMIKCPHGVILVTGPTGSGKSTTLYAALGAIARPEVNVVTVEDPVEKQMDGINQCQINVKSGMTFPAALRSILRQDPDIIMIGEMRDGETAEIGIRAAITGHLVLSTLHTNDAASTIVRLIDMGIPAYMVASSLIGVVAQRLVKVLCPKCRKQRMSTEEENELMHIDHSVPIYDAVGCNECGGGYRGRTAIHEIIHCTGNISTLIANGASTEQLESTARANGTKLLRDNVADLVQQGVTTMDELIRVTYAV